MEQAISRADLQSPERTPEPEPADLDAINVRLKQLSNFDFIHHADNTVQESQEAEDEELEFQLFATSKSATEPVKRITLRSPTPASGEPGFVVAERNGAYYFTSTLDTGEQNELDCTAFSGAEILSNSTSFRPGSTYKWKVSHLPLSCLSSAIQAQLQAEALKLKVMDAGLKKRTRPNKKSRIKVRVKLAAERGMREGKEVAEREKKVRRNREKKVKKKAREKARKAGGGVGVEAKAGGGEEGGSDGSDDD